MATVVALTVGGAVAASSPAAVGQPSPPGLGDTTASGAAGPPRSAAARAAGPTWTATLVLQFTDPLNGFHPMGITTDGTYYYTTNGGNSGSCVVNTFDLTGTLVRSVPCSLDNRAIIWDPLRGGLFTKDFFLNANRLDPLTGQSTLISSGWFANSQSSPALASDDRHLYEHESGTIRAIRTSDGHLGNTFTGFRTGDYPSDEAAAVDMAGDILTWDGTTVYVQDHHANLKAMVDVPLGHYGFSLSFANGLLFTADDVDGSGTATWYGYSITP
jgi:hypothetical protein